MMLSADVRFVSFLRCVREITDRSYAAFRLSRNFLGGADRVRTDDPLLAKQVLSQLSYSPGPVERIED